MEEAVSVRVELMKERLQELLRRTENVTTISREDLNRNIQLVTSCSGNLNREIHFYMEKASQISQEKIKEWTEVQFKAEEWLADMQALIVERTDPPPEARICTAKLPKLDLPRFKGEVLRWSEFWDRFTACIGQNSISNTDKMAYLFSCLEDEALKAVEGLSINETNYEVACGILLDRYGKKDKIVDAHYDAITNLPRAQEDAAGCRATYDQLERHIRVLQALGESVNGNHLRSAIMSKFPEKVVYELHLLSAEINLDTIRSGIGKIIGAMEMAKEEVKGSTAPVPTAAKDMTTEVLHTSSQHKMNQFRPNLQKGRFSQKYNRNSALKKEGGSKRKLVHANEAVPQSSKKPKKSCIFCQGSHYNAECSIVKTVDERRKKLGSRCYTCFREGHRSAACSFGKACYFCKGRHNQALCTKNNTDSSSRGGAAEHKQS